MLKRVSSLGLAREVTFAADNLDNALNDRASLIELSDEFSGRLDALLSDSNCSTVRELLVEGFEFLEAARDTGLQCEDIVVVEPNGRRLTFVLDSDIASDSINGRQIWYKDNGFKTDRFVASLMNYFHKQTVFGFLQYVFAVTEHVVEKKGEGCTFESSTSTHLSYPLNLDHNLVTDLKGIGTTRLGGIFSQMNHQRFSIQKLFI